MKFLVDNPLSFRVAEGLQSAGFDAHHVRDYGMSDAPDSAILERAYQEQRIIITEDRDFGTLLALSKMPYPSVILLRHFELTLAPQQVALLLVNLPYWQEALETGCIIVVEPKRVRIRELPIGD